MKTCKDCSHPSSYHGSFGYCSKFDNDLNRTCRCKTIQSEENVIA